MHKVFFKKGETIQGRILSRKYGICIALPYDYINVILIFKKFLSQAMLIKVAVNADNKFDSNNK